MSSTARDQHPPPDGTDGTASTRPPGSTRRTLVGTGIGNALEWFDWGVFAIFAPFFATQFFDPADPVSAFLSTLVVFAVGFLARPLGGLLFGWVADRYGRKLSMSATVAAAALGSLVIAASPTYESVGVVASLLLVGARLVQGLAHGGELPSAQTYIAEFAPDRDRGLWSSLIYVSGTLGNVVGVLIGAVLTSLLSRAEMVAWGWRIPFVVGGLLGLYALYMRTRLHETEVFDADTPGEPGATTSASASGPREPRPRIWPELVRHRRQAAKVIGMTVGLTVTFYVWAIAAPGYAIAALDIDPTSALWAGVVANLVFVAVLPLWGRLSDRVGRRPVLLFATLGSAAAMFPLNALLQDSAWQLLVAMLIGMVLVAGACAVVPAAFAEMFPTRIRTIGVGIPYSVAVATFGGTAPYLQTWIGAELGRSAFSGYVVLLLLVSAAVLWSLPETRGRSLHDEVPAPRGRQERSTPAVRATAGR